MSREKRAKDESVFVSPAKRYKKERKKIIVDDFAAVLLFILLHTKKRCKWNEEMKKMKKKGGPATSWTIYAPSPTKGLRAPGLATGPLRKKKVTNNK